MCWWGWRAGRKLNATIEGPYVFATGALEVLSNALVRVVFHADQTRRYVAAQLLAAADGPVTGAAAAPASTATSQEGAAPYQTPAPQPLVPERRPREWVRWSCAAEDSLIGLAIYRMARAYGSGARDVPGLFPIIAAAGAP